jgi:hypothetical protein
MDPVAVGNADGAEMVTLGARQDESQPLYDVSVELLPGAYQLGARMLDPVTGEVLSEDIERFTVGTGTRGRALQSRRDSTPSLLAVLKEWGEYGIANAGAEGVSAEVKMWLEAPGETPVPVLSVGADASLVLAPGDSLSLDPLAHMGRPSPGWILRARIIDPVTGRILQEHTTKF